MSSLGDPRLPPRFWSKVAPDPSMGCWMWTASLDSHGYANFRQGQTRRGHRVAYEALVGPVPEGLVLDHRVCSRRSCVNPDHLQPCTNRENLDRSERAVYVANRVVCASGHQLVVHGTERRCPICEAAYQANWRSSNADKIALHVARRREKRLAARHLHIAECAAAGTKPRIRRLRKAP